MTGYRWCDVPRGETWASKSSAHRWLKRWESDGTLETLQARILGIAEERGLINWSYGKSLTAEGARDRIRNKAQKLMKKPL